MVIILVSLFLALVFAVVNAFDNSVFIFAVASVCVFVTSTSVVAVLIFLLPSVLAVVNAVSVASSYPSFVVYNHSNAAIAVVFAASIFVVSTASAAAGIHHFSASAVHVVHAVFSEAALKSSNVFLTCSRLGFVLAGSVSAV